MAVLFDASTEIAAGSTASPTTGTHTPVGTPRGVEVFISYPTGTDADVGDIISGVTYGGVAMSRVGIEQDITNESGTVVQYFLGAGIPTGPQTVSVQRTEAITAIHVVCRTITAAGDMERIATAGVHESQANPAVVLSLGGREAIVLGGLWDGVAALSGIVETAGMTRDRDHDFGASTSVASRQTTPGTSDFTFGYTVVQSGTAMIASAFGEIASDTTRFYMLGDLFGEEDDPDNAPAVIPDVSANWDSVSDSFIRGRARSTKVGMSQTFAVSEIVPETGTQDRNYAQFISDALAAQTIDTNFNLAARANEADVDVNAHLAWVLRVVKPDGTERAELASSLTTDVEFPVDSSFPTRVFSAIPVGPQAVLDGDRLVLELGIHAETPVSEIAALLFQTDEFTSDSPLANNDVSDSDTWFELEQDITFAPVENAWAFGAPMATLSGFASGTVVTTTPVSGSGAPVTSLSPTASGTAFTEDHATGSGAPVGSLSAFADGEATMTPPPSITASGAPVVSLDSFAQGLAQNPNGGAPAPRPKAKGGGAMRVISFEDPPEPKKPEPKPKKVKPTPEAVELQSKDMVLPEIGIKGLAPETLQAFKQRLQIRLPDPKMPAPEVKDKRSVEDRLLEHFMQMVGVADLPQDDDLPFELQRFLRMGKGE